VTSGAFVCGRCSASHSFLGVYRQPGGKKPWMRLVQILLLAAALVSVRPLQDWAFGAGTPDAGAELHAD
jgi:thiol:disulfide interchange protein